MSGLTLGGATVRIVSECLASTWYAINENAQAASCLVIKRGSVLVLLAHASIEQETHGVPGALPIRSWLAAVKFGIVSVHKTLSEMPDMGEDRGPKYQSFAFLKTLVLIGQAVPVSPFDGLW